ncbi:MAG TPA: Gx transporter family protein [Candidatus Limiplasma sp.]|nr:Gx transporter family protein [Candidatus Limiplasma sp.]HPS80687.1 Gx transporter family protein [Candidatus Limiplasma sp.]
MNKTGKLTLAAILIAVMIVLGYLESLLPVSAVPGIKLGLSNCVLLISLYWLGVAVSFEIMVVKVVLLGFLFGNPMMILYSLAGGALSLTVMSLLQSLKGVSPIGIGVAGGVTHNIGQVAVAMLILQTPSLIYYLGILMPVGAGMGFLTGSVAKILMRSIPPLRRLQKREETQVEENNP